MNVKAFWTYEQDEVLRRHWKDGLTCSQIAYHMSKTRNAIIGRAHRIFLNGRAPVAPPVPRRRRQAPSKPVSRTVNRLSEPAASMLAEINSAVVISSPFQPKPLGEPASLMERHPAGCAWSIAYIGQHVFCNGHRLANRPYCPTHWAQSFTKSLPTGFVSIGEAARNVVRKLGAENGA